MRHLSTLLSSFALVCALACALAVSVGIARPARAQAQLFTVLPVDRDARVPSSERNAAFTAVSNARVLGPSSQFMAVGELEPRMASEFRSLTACTEVDCAARLADAAGLDVVIVIAVWPGDDGRATTVGVSLVSPSGAIHEGDAHVGREGVAQAATQALVAAVRHRERGEGVELRVTSRPEGALVVVDNTEVGVTPYSGAFARGAHSVEVRLRGMAERRDVELEERPMSLDVDLENGTTHVGTGDGDGANGHGASGDGLGGGVAAPTEEPSIWNFILGGGLLAAGVLAVVPPIVTLARDGEVTGNLPDGREVVRFGAASGVLLGIGIAALAGGAFFVFAQPFQVSASPSQNGGMLHLTGTF